MVLPFTKGKNSLNPNLPSKGVSSFSSPQHIKEQLFGKRLPPQPQRVSEAQLNLAPNNSYDDANKVLVGKKVLHQSALHGMISRGGSEIDLGNGRSLKFVVTGPEWVIIQEYQYALDTKVEKQVWQRPVKVKSETQQQKKQREEDAKEPIKLGTFNEKTEDLL